MGGSRATRAASCRSPDPAAPQHPPRRGHSVSLTTPAPGPHLAPYRWVRPDLEPVHARRRCRIPCQGQDNQQVSRLRLHGSRLLRPCPRPARPRTARSTPTNDFGMTWEVAADSRKHVRAIAEALKTDDTLILATDPDREGEAISWHLQEALASSLKKGKTVSPRHLQRDHQIRRDRGDGQTAPGRHGAGRGLPRPPRARLSGRLQPLARPVAQAARREVGRPRASPSACA